jgi:hypothetical protein
MRGNRGVSTAVGRLPPPCADQAAVRDSDALEALHDDLPLEAGMDQADPSSGDDVGPSTLESGPPGSRPSRLERQSTPAEGPGGSYQGRREQIGAGSRVA